MKRLLLVSTWVLVFLSVLILSRNMQASQSVSLPLTLDYGVLRTLVVEQAFTDPGESVTVVNSGNGCIKLTLSEPQISEQGGLLRNEMKLFISVGTPLGGRCYAPLEWSGYLVLYQQPRISRDNWLLSFSTTGAELLANNRQPITIANILWQLVESKALSYVEDIFVDLLPPVKELKQFLLPLFPEETRNQAERMLTSMRPGKLTVDSDSLKLSILADVETIYEHDDNQNLEPLTEGELERVVSIWENWDGLLIYLITIISKESLKDTEQQILRNLLLETRYQFVYALSDKTISKDFVRKQFVYCWRQLAPIFRAYLFNETDSAHALGYLAFVSAADSLLVFDQLGPTFGIEISRSGLIRLVNMLQADPELLKYRSHIRPELQDLFQITPERKYDEQKSLPEKEPVNGATLKKQLPILARIYRIFGLHQAYAELPTFKEILQWKVPETDVAAYVGRVNQLLSKSSIMVWDNASLPEQRASMFHNLITAMAWQESCFRQFVVKKKRLTYLLSYNQSSVGLMQINERVWRGIFNRESLRWDINYNADAGCQITALYMRKYALRDRQVASDFSDDTLARLVYAMYNGGPSQYKKFLERLETGTYYDSDNLFWQKYQWVTTGNLDKATMCLSGI